MKSLYQFRLLDELKASDTQVRISQLIGRKNEDGSLKDVEFQKETVVLQNGDGSVFEMAFASASGGMLTFHKRGLNENNPPVEIEHNKKTWGNGTKCYVTAGAGDFIDKDEPGVWNGKQTFEGGIIVKGDTAFDGQIDAKRGVKNPTFASKEEATSFFSESEKVEGLLVNIKGNTYRWNSITKSWEMLGLADINQEKVQENSTKISTLEEKLSTAEGQISQLVEARASSYLGKIMTVGEIYQEGDEMYEKNGKLYKRYSIKNVNNITYSGNYQGIDCGQYTVENGELVRVEIGNFNVPEGHNIHLVFTDSAYNYNNPGAFIGKKYGEIRLYGGESGKKIVLLSGYSGGSVFVTAGHNGSYITATISNIKFITKKTGEGISFYPREIKGVDEKVECTIIGLHSDGNYIGSKKMPINKSIEGRASAEWTAPANGLLEFQYYTSNAFSFLNNRMLHERRGGDMPHYLYVTSGEIVRISVDDRGRSGTGTYKTTLLSFIPL